MKFVLIGRYRFETTEEIWTRLSTQLEAMGATASGGSAGRAFTDVMSDKDPLVLYFLIDQSGSITEALFKKSIDFVITLIGKVSFNIANTKKVWESMMKHFKIDS